MRHVTEAWHRPSPDQQRPLVIAHRGASRAAPENTVAAFNLAVSAGADMIETDAQLSADGAVVLSHDADLLRATGRPGRIDALTLEQILEYDAGFTYRAKNASGYPYRDRGVRVPVLDDVLDRLSQSNRAIALNVEIKRQGGQRTAELSVAVCRLLRDREALDTTLVSSFDEEALAVVRSTEPELNTAMLVDADADLVRAATVAGTAGHIAIHPHASLVGAGEQARARVVAIHAAGLRVHVWTVDDPARMRELLDAGVDGIITNDPATLRWIIDQTAATS